MKLETFLSLRISFDTLDPDDVSRVLRLSPDRTHRKGDPVSKASSTFRKAGYWSLSSERHVPATESFDAHACWLLDRIEPVAPQLTAWRTQGWLVDLWLVALSDAAQGGPVIAADVLRRLGALGLPLNIDLYPSAFERE